ncbi:MAG: Do family serine endopeptidase [Candidatus Omnitrophota bacterium]|jgi:serine protease Do
MKKTLIVSTAFLITGVVIGIMFSARMDILPPGATQGSQPVGTVSSAQEFNIEDAVIKVAGTSGKAVVSISTEHTAKVGGARRYYYNAPSGESPFNDDDPFRKFFDDFFGEMPEREYKKVGLGSGVIIDPEGYILTNEHVISEADKIKVTLSDGREFKAEVKGQDPRADLAVIKINARNLPAAKLGDSDSVKIGQWVVAIGNPFGFALQNPEPTVTAGVISALHRSLGRTVSRDKDMNDLIQTDAAINPGNSGGPLVNLRGEVVGINVAIFSTSGGYQGIGFAIPVNNAKRIMSKLIEGKDITYGWLGVSVQDLNDDLAQYFGVPDKKGALVVDVLAGGPAEKNGMKKSDIIVRFDNNPVANVRELLTLVGKEEVGRKIKVAVLRDKREQPLDIVIGARPQNLKEQEMEEAEKSLGVWRGLHVQDLQPEIKRRYKIETQEGIVVVDVEPDSLAAEAGIFTGDVIIEINKQKIRTLADYQRVTAGLKSGDALVVTLRGYLVIKDKPEER